MVRDYGEEDAPRSVVVEFAPNAAPAIFGGEGEFLARVTQKLRVQPDTVEAARFRSQEESGVSRAHIALTLAPDDQLGQVREALAAEFGSDIQRVLPVPNAIPALGPAAFEAASFAVETPDFSQLQGYAGSPPVGLGFNEVAFLPGADGTGVTVMDFEAGWQLEHEALGPIRFNHWTGIPSDKPGWIEHGTAVSSILFSPRDGLGISGLVPGARGVLGSIYAGAPPQQRVAQQIQESARFLANGDVLLIEVQRPGPLTDYQADADQRGYLPVSFWPDVRDAIRSCVLKGITVVEVGGNGGVDLDGQDYADVFDQAGSTDQALAPTDSGSIMVGAGAPFDGGELRARGRMPFSNFGQRLDCQAWGQSVVAAGYGDLWGSTRRSYTAKFLGTSSAGPLVAAAVAAIQGRSLYKFGRFVPPLVLRRIFASYGIAQAVAQDARSAERIGPMPSLPYFFRLLDLF